MEYHLNIIEDDYIRGNVFHIKEPTAAKYTTIMSVYLGIYLAAFLWRELNENFVAETILFVCSTLNLLLVLFQLWWSRNNRWLRHKIRKLRRKGKLPPHKNAAIVLQEWQFLWRYDGGEIRVPYTDVADICLENGILCLYTRAPKAFVIPIRCLKGEADKVIEYLTKRTGKHSTALIK